MKSIWKLLLSNLSTDSYITASQLGEKTALSEKTVRNHIKELSDFMVDYGAYIESKHGFGFRFIVTDQKKYNTWYLESIVKGKTDSAYIPENSEERCNYIICKLLNTTGYADIDEIINYLCISEKTFTNDSIKIKKILDEYHLKLQFKKNEGVRITGNEFNKRIFFINNTGILQSIDDEDKTYIINKLLEILAKYEISMPEISIENMCQHLYFAVKRIKQGEIIKDENLLDISNKEDGLISSSVAEEMCNDLENKYNIKFSKAERENIVIHLLGHRVTERYSSGQSNVVISQEIHDLVMDILMFIYITMKIDLRKNLRLIMNLAVHLVSLQIRIKYNIYLKNPMLDDIKKKYPLGYTIACQAKIYIDKHYQTNINDDEIGYLALIFELSVKKDSAIQKKNILIVCATGKTSAELLAMQYREMFGPYLNIIKTCNISDLEDQNINNYDYLLTTTPISISIPIPILYVKLFMSDEEEIELKNKLSKDIEEKGVKKYLKRNLFFPCIKASNKEDAIQKMCELISQNISIPSDFAEKVLKRESFGSTDFGQNIALAHPYGITTESTFLAVGILDDYVFWGNRNVKIVLMISVSDNIDQDLEDFYRDISKFMLNKNKTDKLLKNPTIDNFFELVEESGKE